VLRKATCRALFSKMLYLVECDLILKPSTMLNIDVLRSVCPPFPLT
jgi:hypothetical protein